jgi:cytochrome c
MGTVSRFSRTLHPLLSAKLGAKIGDCTRFFAVLVILVAALFAQSPKYGVGRTPTSDEIKAWDITIRPDGEGLPEGKGSAVEGREVYARICTECHGDKGQGSESVPLVGGIGSLTTDKPLKTVGSFWPYATTVFDYTRRSMPFDRPGTLTDNQVYAVVAFVLHLNGIIEENQVLDSQTLPQVKMPNRDGFIPDTRPDVAKK